jgi:hypothetical protein
LRRRLQRPRDHYRNRLVGVAHAIVLQQVEPERERVGLGVRVHGQRWLVPGRHHIDDTGMAFRCIHIEKRDTATRDAARGDDCVEHAWEMVVGGVARRACHLQYTVATGERLANVGAMADVGGRLAQSELRHVAGLRAEQKMAKREGRERAPACRHQQGSVRGR